MRTTLRQIFENLQNELINAQAEGYSFEACRTLARELAESYHGDPWFSDTRVMVRPGQWAYVRVRGNGDGDIQLEVLRYEEAERADGNQAATESSGYNRGSEAK